MMDVGLAHYENEELLELIHKAFKQWKWVEINYHYPIHADRLKEAYLSLLMEARKRNLSLTPEQLLDYILFPTPGDET